MGQHSNFLGLISISTLIQLGSISAETASLFEHSEFRGSSLEIDFNGCFNLPGEWNDRASSINTHGMCIRVWENGNCGGRSTDVQPGSPSHNNLHSLGFGDFISSVSPCGGSGGGGSTPGSTSGGDWRQAALELHNQYRSRHGAAPLSFSDEVNQSAQRCAEYLASRRIFAHVCRQQLGHSYGENLALRFEDDPTVAGVESTKAFYAEEPQYDYNSNDFQHPSGHFSQVVWKYSQRLGLGYAKNGDFKVVVAHYDPPGNYEGQFIQNVERPRF